MIGVRKVGKEEGMIRWTQGGRSWWLLLLLDLAINLCYYEMSLLLLLLYLRFNITEPVTVEFRSLNTVSRLPLILNTYKTHALYSTNL